MKHFFFNYREVPYHDNAILMIHTKYMPANGILIHKINVSMLQLW